MAPPTLRVELGSLPSTTPDGTLDLRSDGRLSPGTLDGILRRPPARVRRSRHPLRRHQGLRRLPPLSQPPTVPTQVQSDPGHPHRVDWEGAGAPRGLQHPQAHSPTGGLLRRRCELSPPTCSSAASWVAIMVLLAFPWRGQGATAPLSTPLHQPRGRTSLVGIVVCSHRRHPRVRQGTVAHAFLPVPPLLRCMRG